MAKIPIISVSLFTFSLLASIQAKTLTVEERVSHIETNVHQRIPAIIKTINQKNTKLTVAIFKTERIVEVWQTQPSLKKLKVYKFTKFSGKLGPKNRQGDRQIPEGVYSVPLLNPNSKYYLSARLNYPNELDKKRAKFYGITKPGNDIYIHGKNKTIGCIPIGDSNMEELFFIFHKVGLNNLKVVISPNKLPLPPLEQLGVPKQDSLTHEKYRRIEASLKGLDLKSHKSP